MKLKFTGTEPELTIMDRGGLVPVRVVRGGECDVTSECADSLLKRGDFEAVEAKGAKK